MREFEIKFRLGIIREPKEVIAHTFEYNPKEKRLVFLDEKGLPVALFNQANWVKSVVMKVDSQEFDIDDVEITEQANGWYKMELRDDKY